MYAIKILLLPKIFVAENFCCRKFLLPKIFGGENFWWRKLLLPRFSGDEIFLGGNFSTESFCQYGNYYDSSYEKFLKTHEHCDSPYFWFCVAPTQNTERYFNQGVVHNILKKPFFSPTTHHTFVEIPTRNRNSGGRKTSRNFPSPLNFHKTPQNPKHSRRYSIFSKKPEKSRGAKILKKELLQNDHLNFRSPTQTYEAMGRKKNLGLFTKDEIMWKVYFHKVCNGNLHGQSIVRNRREWCTCNVVVVRHTVHANSLFQGVFPGIHGQKRTHFPKKVKFVMDSRILGVRIENAGREGYGKYKLSTDSCLIMLLKMRDF